MIDVYLLLITFTDRTVFCFYPGISVNGMVLRVKARELSTDLEFKASLGWYQKWKRRHSISMRAKTTLAQRLPADMEDKIVTFRRFVVRTRRRCEYPLSHIINMDETPMRFELPATRTLHFTGNRTVPIMSCGADKQSFTVALAVKANGEKLPPKVIFKASVSSEFKCRRECRFQCIKKAGWMKKVMLCYFYSPPKTIFHKTQRVVLCDVSNY